MIARPAALAHHIVVGKLVTFTCGPLTTYFSQSPTPRYEAFLISRCEFCGRIVEAVACLPEEPE